MIKFIVKNFTPKQNNKGKFIGEAEGELIMDVCVDDKNIVPCRMPIKRIGVMNDAGQIKCFSDAKSHKDTEGKWVRDYHYNDFSDLNANVWRVVAEAISDHLKQKEMDLN